MSNIKVDYDILNQKQTPAFYASSLATRPAFGFPGRIFIDTDTPSSGIYRDTGSAWVQVADPGAGTTGTLQQVTTNGNTTTLGVTIQGIDINDGAGTGVSNTAIGLAALQLNTTGAYNTAIGYGTLQANTTGGNNVATGYYSLFANTTGVNNVAIGYGTLTANTTGSANTGVGYLSLSANTTAGSNTSIGHEALRNNTTGAQNTAIGHQALRINTTGQYNVSVGQDSLANNIIGSSNTAIGQGSLRHNTANGNTAIGFSSLNVNTTGSSNTAVGSSALSLNTTGSNNTAVGVSSSENNTTGAGNSSLGFNSLRLNTTGASNTAIGYGALNVNTIGINNTALGYNSLSANTTANRNTAIGVSSLGSNTTGDNNTAIGYNAGVSITTGSNNTIIGGYGGTTTLTSNIVLSDGAGNVRLFANDTGKVGINVPITDTPTGQVDIHTSLTNALVLNGISTNNAYLGLASAGVNKWRIGNTYNAGANSFDIFNLGTSSNALSFNSTTNAATFSSSVTANSTISAYYGNITSGNAPASSGTTPVNAMLNLTNNRGIGMYFGGSYSGNYGQWIQVSDVSNLGVYYPLFLNPNGGNVLIGTTTDDTVNKLQVTGSAKVTTSTSFCTTSGTMSVGIGLQTDKVFIYNPSGTNCAFTIQQDGTGNIIQVNGNSGAGRLVVTQAGVVTISNLAGTGSRAVLADASGNLSAPVSDISVKENINTIGYGLNEILKMNPVWFNYNDEYKNYGEGRQNGNIAQEMEAIIPEAVFTTPTTGKMGINYDQLHAVYIKAIQELKAEIEALKNN